MWFFSFLCICLAVLVFWPVGAYKRMKRLRREGQHAFTALDAQLVQMLDIVRSCARNEPPAREEEFAREHARQALFPRANLVEAALQSVRQQNLSDEYLVQLNSAWSSLHVAWMRFIELREVSSRSDSDGCRDWHQIQALLGHCAEQFNASVTAYNSAIAQFPASVLARVGGFKPGQIFQKDAVSEMQPKA